MTASLELGPAGIPRDAGPPAPDQDDLLRFEQALLRIVRSVFRPTGGHAGVDKAGYVTLVQLGRTGAVRLSDLAASMELDLSTVSRQVKVLEGLDLVARRADPDDGRAAVLDLTDAGRAELQQQRDRRFQTLAGALAQMSPRDSARLVDLLDHLAAGLPVPDGCPTASGRTSR